MWLLLNIMYFIYLDYSLPLAVHRATFTLSPAHHRGSGQGEAAPPGAADGTAVLTVTFQNLPRILLSSLLWSPPSMKRYLKPIFRESLSAPFVLYFLQVFFSTNLAWENLYLL